MPENARFQSSNSRESRTAPLVYNHHSVPPIWYGASFDTESIVILIMDSREGGNDNPGVGN